MQLHIMDTALAKGRNEQIGFLNQMVNLALEHGDPREDEMTLVGVLDGAGAVQIEQVHLREEWGEMRHASRKKEAAGRSTWLQRTVTIQPIPTAVADAVRFRTGCQVVIFGPSAFGFGHSAV